MSLAAHPAWLLVSNREPASVRGLWWRFRRHSFRALELTTILNRCHRFRGFVYEHAGFSADKKSVEVAVRPQRLGHSLLALPFSGAGYDQLTERRFEFIPLWG